MPSNGQRIRNGKNDAASSIASIVVSNYKSIGKEQRLEIKPLTLLAGSNSSGKSSIVQPLLLLKQTLDAAAYPGAIKLDGPHVYFTRTDHVLHKRAGRTSTDRFSVGIALSHGPEILLTYRRVPQSGFDIDAMRYTDATDSFTIRPDMTSRDIEAALPQYLTISAKASHHKITRDRCFLAIESIEDGDDIPIQPVLQGFEYGHGFPRAIRDILHVPGLRGNPQRTYQRTVAKLPLQGTFDSYVAGIIAEWKATKDQSLGELGKSLDDLGLTWKVDVRPVDDTSLELRVGRTSRSARGGAQDLVSIADVGFGVSQVLPVIVALLSAGPGQMVYLEQPELHLHPKAQHKLAYLLAAAAKRGVVVVAETHSSILLRGIQTQVAANQLDRSLIKLNWFERDSKTGQSVVSTADLDEDGAFGEWPADFDEVEMTAEAAYLDAIEEKRRVHD